MGVETPDNRPEHLFPPFNAKLQAAIALANHDTAGKFDHFDHWALFEGYRSQARQEWLYAQGRTRPGAIVTYKRGVSGYHPRGLAGDVVWYDHSGTPHWDGPAALWAILGHCARANGLIWGGDWQMADLPHIQPNDANLVSWAGPAKAHMQSLGLA